MINAPLGRFMARSVWAGALALAIAAVPARATEWRPADTDITLDFAPRFVAVLTFGDSAMFGVPVPPGIDPGAALTDPVAMSSADTLRGTDEDALFGMPLRMLSPDVSAYDAGAGTRDPGANWYDLVRTLSNNCETCVGKNQTTEKLDLMKHLGLLPKFRNDDSSGDSDE